MSGSLFGVGQPQLNWYGSYNIYSSRMGRLVCTTTSDKKTSWDSLDDANNKTHVYLIADNINLKALHLKKSQLYKNLVQSCKFCKERNCMYIEFAFCKL